MKRLRIVLPLCALGLGLLAGPVYAHGFGERTELPVPLGYFLVGAGAAVAVSFAVIGYFARGNPREGSYWHYNLFNHWWLRTVLTNPLLLLPFRLLSVFLLGLVVAAGLVGDETPTLNFAPTLVWIIWWVGMAFAVSLIGNVWALINPWQILFGWAEGLYRWTKPEGKISPPLVYPRRWGIWPAVFLFLCFAWLQDAFPQSALPDRVAVMAIVYSAITWAGMALFGKHQWLRHGEAFSVVFGLFAKFAPTEVKVRDQGWCRTCDGRCLDQEDECINCYECFERTGERDFNLRPFAMGLSRIGRMTNDKLAMVILLLATVTFDGFSATGGWADFRASVVDVFSGLVHYAAFNSLTVADTIGVLLFPIAFAGVYLIFSYFMSGAAAKGRGALDLARVFAYSLIPIALAYNIAHFINLLLVQGQLIIPLASDPFGYDWNWFGTADYQIYIGVINARVVWFLSVAVIIIGHIMAVYLAHLASIRIFRDRAIARSSQYPMMTLMVIYTVVSLWIIAQPIVA